MSRQLWIGAGMLFVSAFTLKQYMWHRISNQVKNIRDEENRVATAALEYTYEESKKYIVPELTAVQRRKLAKLSKEERKMFFLFTEEEYEDFDELDNKQRRR